MLNGFVQKLKWGIDRWKIMQHPMEELYRVQQQYQYRVVDKKWMNMPPLDLHFNYCPLPMPWSKDALKELVGSTIGNLNEYQLLNIKIGDILNNHNWNYDFKNNVEGQCKNVHQIDEFNYSLGDSRYFYELGRLHYLPVAMASAVSKDDVGLREHLKGAIREWYSQNPFLKTLAWKSGNEVGIRVVNLLYFKLLLDFANDKDDDFEDFFSSLLELHYKFIVSHLSLYSSKGNHHIGEIAGVIAICCCYEFKESHSILEKYVREMESEVQRLIYHDGFNREQSTNYQTSYLNLVVTAFLFAKRRGVRISEACRDRIKNGYDYLDVLRVEKGEYFHIGDTDNAELLYPYADGNYNIYESQLNDAVILFGKKKKREAYYDLRNYLMFGDDGYSMFEKAPIEETTCYSVLKKDSGNFIVKDDIVSILLDCGQIGLLPSMCHGHADILNVLLYVDNKPILVDCGCYQYNNNFKKYRDYFHGTSSHNLIVVNDENQAKLGTGMFWMNNPEVKVEEYNTSENSPYIMASHTAYQKSYGIVHQRRLDYHKENREIVITDHLYGGQRVKLSFYLHFYPEYDVKLIGDEITVEGVKICNRLFHQGKLIYGDEFLPLGWYSPRYDSKVPTTSFVTEMSVEGALEIQTRINF